MAHVDTPALLTVADYARRCGITEGAARDIAEAHPDYTEQTGNGETRIKAGLLFAYRDAAGNMAELNERERAAASEQTRNRPRCRRLNDGRN